MKALFSLFVFLCLSAGYLQAQDPVYSQFYAAPMLLNPAMTGLTEGPQITTNYRNQWPGIDRAYETYSVAYGQYFSKLNSSFGGSILADRAGNGLYNSTMISAFYAYDIRVDKHTFFRVGFEGSAVNTRLDWDRLIFLDQIDPESGATDPNGNPNPTEEQRPAQPGASFFDVGLGFLVHTRYFYGGMSFKHLNTPDEGILRINNNFGEMPERISLHFGSEIDLGKGNKIGNSTFISPNVLLVKQGSFYQLNMGAYARRENIFGGIWFRHTFTNADAVILMAGWQWDVFKMAYSYDWNISRLGAFSQGAHEISLQFNFEGKSRPVDYNDCLRMFR